jgi:peptidyl-dipeptidase Dcp
MNPFLEKSNLQRQFDDALPFDLIKTEHFEPAFDRSLTEARHRLSEIASSQEPPTFQNTIEALEFVSESLDQVSSVFSNLLHANTSPQLQALAKTLMPKLSEFSNDLFLNPDLFKRVKFIFERFSNLNLSQEQGELLKKTYRHFLRNGALLDDEKKKSLRKIDERLSLLGREFSDHVLQATQSFFLPLIEEADFLGLPDWYRAQCQAAGKERGQPNPGVTLDAPLFVPFLKFSSQRLLREKVWRAYQTRAIPTNTPVMTQIARLKLERANLLGYPSHADYVLEERMAEKPERLIGFFDQLVEPSLLAAKRELEELETFAKAQGHTGKLERWDLSYYSEKLKEAKFKLQEDKLRPYFPLESVIQGVFETANRLYGLKFVPRKELPVYHPDVQVFEVRTSDSDQGGRYIGLLYADFFPRPSKQGGAWMTTFRDQGRASDGVKRPTREHCL